MPGRSDDRSRHFAVAVAAAAGGGVVGVIAALAGQRAALDGFLPTLALLAVALAPLVAAAGLIARRERRLEALAARDAELARMSWRLDFALGASEIGLWDVDLATDELMWDDRARALLGVPERDGFYNEADWLAVVHPEDRERAVAAANAAVAAGGRFMQDYRVVRPGGEIRHIRDMAAVYRGADGSHRLLGLIWDVTADVRRQEELELRRAEAEAAAVAKSQFLAAMSHEIRTPMTGVLGMLDLMLGEPLPPRARERAAIARASAGSLLQILNDVLEFSKLEAGRVELREQDTPTRQVIRDVMDLMAAGAEQRRLTLTCTIAPRTPDWIVADAMRLRQVLTNLVSNATKFTETGGVAVRVDHVEGELRVEVEDTGIGIAPDDAARLFEEFFQADNSLSRRRGGTGLGLAISKQLVELMGGRIAVRSVPGAGSTFAFGIPAPPGRAPERAAPDGIAAAAPAGADPPLRILVAEDNATNQYLVRAYLERAGHTVTTVADGREAVRAAAGQRFDVVLMDVHMPEMDGPSAARAIRALPGAAGRVPIIALTANTLRGDREAYAAAGMVDYISKPIDFAALSRALRRACDPAAAGGAQDPGGPSRAAV